MKTEFACLVVVLLVGLSCGPLSAQDLFSGAGIRSAMPDEEPTKSRWPKLLDFSKEKPASRPFQPFSGLSGNTKKPEPEEVPTKALFSLPSFNKPTFERPSFNWLKKKPALFEERSTDTKSAFADLIPKRDPNTPNLFQQMNSKSKDFFDRTTGWTERKNRNLRAKSNETWDSITKDIRAYQREKPTAPAQPPIRTAEAPRQSKIRF